MIDPQLFASWSRFLAGSASSSPDMREALMALGRVGSPDELATWAARFAPREPGSAAAAPTTEWLERSWEAMGFVPRARYLKLLEHSEHLRRQVEEAEATIRGLRELLATTGQSEEARRIFTKWEGPMRESMQAYTDWLGAWTKVGSAHATIDAPAASSDHQAT
jgi:hypothetical protein